MEARVQDAESGVVIAGKCDYGLVRLDCRIQPNEHPMLCDLRRSDETTFPSYCPPPP